MSKITNIVNKSVGYGPEWRSCYKDQLSVERFEFRAPARKVLPHTSGQADGPRRFCEMITVFFSGINQTMHVVGVKEGYRRN